MTIATNINIADGDFRHPDFLQSLELDIKENKILKLFVKMKENQEINKLRYNSAN